MSVEIHLFEAHYAKAGYTLTFAATHAVLVSDETRFVSLRRKATNISSDVI